MQLKGFEEVTTFLWKEGEKGKGFYHEAKRFYFSVFCINKIKLQVWRDNYFNAKYLKMSIKVFLK